MLEFKFKETARPDTKFSEMHTGQFFCHSLPPTSIFMKKQHEYGGRDYQAIDVQSGASMTTQGNAVCYILEIKAVATLA